MKLPAARGPVSSAIVGALATQPGTRIDPVPVNGALCDADLQLSLAICYELYFHGFDDVDDEWEWDHGLLAVRATLERAFSAALKQECAVAAPAPLDICAALRDLVAHDDGPNLSGYLARRAGIEEFRDFIAQRSIYHLREADPHTFGIPRLTGRAKAALVEIQSDEYGGGIPGRTHAELFAQLMRGVGLPANYGRFWDTALPEMLTIINAMSLFALHRGRRGSLLGHLAALEMTSTTPNRRYGNGLRRLGFGPDVTRFYDEHVEADAVHEQIACVDLCGSFVADNPALAGDVLFGARCCLRLDGIFAEALLSRWQSVAVA
jgi:heme oxygenase-like protein